MTETEFTELSDEELEKKKKAKSASIINALFIGVMIGIIIYSIVKNTYGFFTLIPLYIVFRAFNSSKNNKTIEKK